MEVVKDLPTLLNFLQTGKADFTVLTATLIHSLEAPPEQPVDFAALKGLPPIEVGAYLSRSRLSPSERDDIARSLTEAVRRGELLRLYRQHYPQPVFAADLKYLTVPGTKP